MRYFLKVAYVGTVYAGSQIQDNAKTVQSTLQENMQIALQQPISLTGASRTDAGVHAWENYFHFDTKTKIEKDRFLHAINALLPADVAVYDLLSVSDDTHSRFDAISRSYTYLIEQHKNPFLSERAYLFRKTINTAYFRDLEQILLTQKDFTSFSKKHTDTHSCICDIVACQWEMEDTRLSFHVSANRFLRGMVRALVATQLLVLSGEISLQAFEDYFHHPRLSSAKFNAPACGLYLRKIHYPAHLFYADE